jgi:hypothetical protein
MPEPTEQFARLMEFIKPGSMARSFGDEAWEPPPFAEYEDIRRWLGESVISASLYERYPDGRWTIQFLLKEQNPGTYRYLTL